MDLATRQEHQFSYNSVMHNTALNSDYRVQYADDNFGLMSAPWLRGMTNKTGRKVCLEIAMINAGWQELASSRRAHGITVARCNVWEPYVINGKLEERFTPRELDSETTLQFTQILRRQTEGHKEEPRADLLEVYEIEPTIREDEDSKEEKLMLDEFMEYIAKVHIFTCYKYANWISYGDSDIVADSPLVLQNSNRNDFGNGGQMLDEGMEDALISAAKLKDEQNGQAG